MLLDKVTINNSSRADMPRRVMHADPKLELQLRIYFQNYAVLAKFTTRLLAELQGKIPRLPTTLATLVNSFRIPLGNTDYHLVVEIPVCPQNQRLTIQTPMAKIIVELSLSRAGSPITNAELGYAFGKPVYKSFDPCTIQAEYSRLLAKLG